MDTAHITGVYSDIKHVDPSYGEANTDDFDALRFWIGTKQTEEATDDLSSPCKSQKRYYGGAGASEHEWSPFPVSAATIVTLDANVWLNNSPREWACNPNDGQEGFAHPKR